MWEIIRANKRKSWMLFIGMGVCLLILGYLIGEAIVGPGGGVPGILAASFVWLIMSLVGYFSGDSIFLATSKARLVPRDVYPRLFNVVEEMKIAAGLPVTPKVYIVDDPAPNAFAVGRKPENAAIAVTAGLLAKLSRDELQGVVAHETSHIHNRDIQFMTFAGATLGGIALISHVFARSVFYSSHSSRRFRSHRRGGGGQAQLAIFAVALAFAILAPILARLLYFAISRRREYLADASAARLTRYPEGLASALEKISSSTADLASANKVSAPMYIVNPLKEKGQMIPDLSSTHPPISQRIKILRSMAGGAGFYDYQKAYTGVTGKGAALIPPSSLRLKEKVIIRQASPEEPRRHGLREVGDIMRAVNEYAFLVCACGMKIKTPPDLKESSVSCPRCGREVELPVAELAAVAAASTSAVADRMEKERLPQRQIYSRRGKGWESFRCKCGRLMQISPSLEAPSLRCKDCGSQIDIVG